MKLGEMPVLEALNDLTCPLCQPAEPCLEPLNALNIACKECGMEFPLLSGKIPVLCRDPKGVLSGACVAFYKQELVAERRLQQLRSAPELRDRLRAGQRSDLIDAIECNLSMIRTMRAKLLEHLTVEGVLKHHLSAPGNDRVADFYNRSFFASLIRDWSGDTSSEHEVDVTMGALREQMEGSESLQGPIVLLGAGCGRYAEELCLGDRQVYAVDLNAPMALGYLAGRFSSPTVSRIDYRNVLDAACRVTPHVLKAGPRFEASKLRYLVADALEPPLRPASIDTIISVFFTDVVPLGPLIRSVRDLLRPGGHFIHFGPLQFHEDGGPLLPALDEVAAEVEAHGFDVKMHDPVAVSHLNSGRTMIETIYKSGRFTATRK